MIKKAATKKAAAKKVVPKLKQGKYAAVLKLRILPEDIKDFDFLLTELKEKNYSTAIINAIKNRKYLIADIEQLKQENEELREELQIIRGNFDLVRDRLKKIKETKTFLINLIDTKI